MSHRTQTEVSATHPRTAPLRSSPGARNDGRKETYENDPPDLSIHSRPAGATAAPTCHGRRPFAVRETKRAGRKQTISGSRCDRLRGLLAKGSPALPTRLLRRVDSGTFQRVFRYS